MVILSLVTNGFRDLIVRYKLQHGLGYFLMVTSIIQPKHFMRVG